MEGCGTVLAHPRYLQVSGGVHFLSHTWEAGKGCLEQTTKPPVALTPLPNTVILEDFIVSSCSRVCVSVRLLDVHVCFIFQ